ncbi:MAG: TonB-dependent receptor [Alistipes sp.]|mgnify:CR=1 FL=1|jgi:tonB-linked outer membrane protein, susC/ragA family|uniref:SusC/RagA family TonB-linked outer membrane protein n=1 Tax=Alistipes TaxID=239759 RepID=UPI001B6D80DE|nr:TonB-dependent receptor [Alistipes sp.]MBP3527124.1 TonB-dependent receptor [Alistipes sp.]
MKAFTTCRNFLYVFCLMLGAAVYGQNITVTGTVVDKAGQPLVGAAVTVKSDQSTRGVSTDGNGQFTLSVRSNAVLTVSYIGYKTETVRVSGTKSLMITLQDDATAMEDVVVVGFGTQKKESVVGAIGTIKAAELSVPVRSLNNSIGGRVAGVIAVQRSGEPGKDDAQFWIRGISTFTGNRNPLILVDGIERPMNNVDPLEIESFSILKDASATAVYGVRGANGVVLITTKRGFDGPAKVDVRYEQGFSFATKRPSYLNAYERSVLFNEAIDANPSASQAMKFTDAELTALRTGSDPELYPDVDWQDVLMRDVTLNEKLSVNISGGGKAVRYFTAVSIYNQEGQYDIQPGNYDWVPSSIGRFGKNVNYTRYNFRSNVDTDITKYTTVSLGLQGNVAVNTEPYEGSDNVYMWINNVAPNAFPVLYKDGKFPARDGLYNPYVQLTQRGYKQTTTNELRSNLTIRQDFSFLTEGLSATVRYAYDAVNYNDAKRSRELTFYQAERRDDDGSLVYKVIDANKQQDYLTYTSSAWGNKTQYFEASFNYDRTFGKHEVGALALFYLKDYKTNTADTYINSLPNRSLGFAARATYGFDKKYLLEVNLGYNGSENFPKNNRMGFFPAVAAGWVISSENFLKDNKTITWLKLRGSVGQVGSDQIGSARFAYLSTLIDAGGYNNFGIKFDQGMGGLQEDQLASEDITWEVATKYNLGLEVGLFNSLRATAEVFYEKRENIFLQPQVSEVMGLQKTMYANMGKMDNRGFEVTLEYNKMFDSGLMFTARGNYTFARNKYIEDGKYYKNPWQDIRGTRYGERLMYDAMHLFSQEEIDALPDYYRQFSLTKSQLRPGDIRYRDVNDDGVISEDDMIWGSNPATPESMFGFGASLAYKGFDFSFLMQGALGGTSYLSAGWYFQPFQAEREPKFMGNLITKFLDRWTEDNPDPYAFSPRLYMGQNVNNYKTSTWWVRNSDYLRLKNVEIGYTLPRHLSAKARIDNARIYLSAVNLYTFSKFGKEFWDPEVGADSYPIQATVFVGLNLTF